MSTIELAALGGSVHIVDYLIKEHAFNPNGPGVMNRTLVHHACNRGHKNLVDELLCTYKSNPEAKDSVELTPLHIAAGEGHIEIVEALITVYKCSTNVQDITGDTPLIISAERGHKDVVKLLIKLGADPCKKNKLDASAVLIAALHGHSSVVDVFLNDIKIKKDLRGYQSQTILHYACNSGQLQLVESLIEKYGCNPMARDDSGALPLHIAVASGQREIVEVLVKKYSCLTGEDDGKLIAMATFFGHFDVASILLSNTKSPETQDSYKRFAVHGAAMKGNCEETISLIKTFNIDPHCTIACDRTILHHACISGNEKLIRELITTYRCDPLAKDAMGITPFHLQKAIMT